MYVCLAVLVTWLTQGKLQTGQEIEWENWRKKLAPEAKVAIIEIGAGTHVPTIRYGSSFSVVFNN